MATTKSVQKSASCGYAANRLELNDESLPGVNPEVLAGIFLSPGYCGVNDAINHTMGKLFMILVTPNYGYPMSVKMRVVIAMSGLVLNLSTL